jgi:hypothetical protein
MTAAAPSGVVTFLFTDVEGSTRRWEANADGMRAALAAHDEVLREAIEALGGWLFKHTGDGMCAAFSSPRAAVAQLCLAGRQPHPHRQFQFALRGYGGMGGGLLRCGAQSCCAGDGRWARRSDPFGRVDCGSARRSGSSRFGAAAVAGSADPNRCVPGTSSRVTHGVPGPAGAGCNAGEPAPADHQLHRPRVRGRRGCRAAAELLDAALGAGADVSADAAVDALRTL